MAHASPVWAKRVLVRTMPELTAATAKPAPGDVIVLADGEWRDADIVLRGEGTQASPITLTAEHPGKVVLTGKSRLRLGGRFLIVSGLAFRNGHTPGDAVISFRADSRRLAENSRVTGVVIDRFNNPDRRAEDNWVAIYGSDNRIDHSHLEGKANAGAMLIVVRRKGMPLDNRARIDHNYFGPRPPLGSNGGETIRIGTSEESGSDSHTVVEDNLFERCDGEVEIVSVKSGGNTIRRNLFLESQGSLVLRHGSGNLVEDNVFLGRGQPHTGGIRVINERQVIRNNYLEGVAGTDFTSALAVMNGVPNSPVNRYMPVRDVTIERNSFVDVRQITIGAGADAERSQPPRDTRITGNLITSAAASGEVLRFDADAGGVVFAGNVLGGGTARGGIAVRPVTLRRAANGLLYPTDPALAATGAPRTLRPVRREEVGVAWYPRPATAPAATTAATAVRIAPGTVITRLPDAGVVELARGNYDIATPLPVTRSMTIRAVPAGGATLRMRTPTLFALEEGGSLTLEGVAVDGSGAGTGGAAVIRTGARPMLTNYRLQLSDVQVSDLSGDVVATTPGTLAGEIGVTGGSYRNIAGAVLALAAEQGAQGWYPAEQVNISGARFDHVGTVVDLLRRGTDESTFGPRFTLTGSSVTASGPVRLSGVQETTVTGNRFVDSAGIDVTHSVGSPHTRIVGNRLTGTPPPRVRELSYKGPVRAVLADNGEGM
ncbi:polysaccharide lyase 6 family protein [Sphingomonas sp. VNH70]|uniref:polysaccharide lyase 6 family protein n=1 Tax=Sphingomonas silueang TaxID=3156617 RepID=UPI0032B47DAF